MDISVAYWWESDDEKRLIEESMRSISPEFRLYDPKRVIAELRRLMHESGDPDMAPELWLMLALREDALRQLSDIPQPWWWLMMSQALFKNRIPDPWNQVRWWLWEEMRGNPGVLTQWGCQNCLAPDVEVLMADGSRKKAKHVKLGDTLMGPDSTPRTVLDLHRGVGPMYRIKPKIGEPWECTANHRLALKCTRRHWCGRASKSHYPGRVRAFRATEYDALSSRKKSAYKQYHVAVELPPTAQFIDPYIYGLWLGDGDKGSMAITNPDREVIDAWTRYFEGRGYRVKSSANNGNEDVRHLHVSGKRCVKTQRSDLLLFLEASVVNGEKRIREDYLVGSLAQRRELLAGLIDSDGCSGGTYFEITTASAAFAEDIARLAGTLGFLVSKRLKQTNYIKKDGSRATAWRLHLSGDVNTIPVKLTRKMPRNKGQTGKGCRTPGCTSIEIEAIGDGEYFGWTVDKDHMFLLANGAATFNSGKTSWALDFIITQSAVWLGYCAGYVSGAWQTHSEDKVWGELEISLASRIRRSTLKKLGVRLTQTNSEFVAEDIAGRSFGSSCVRFPSLDKAGAIAGKKTATDHTDGRLGIIFVYCDEYILNTREKMHRNLANGISNVQSNPNFFATLSCNPDPEDLQLSAGAKVWHDPIDIDPQRLSQELHFRWNTAMGICVRFAWKKSPNYLLRRDKFPYLFDTRRLKTQQTKSQNIQAAQVHAWGFNASGINLFTDSFRIRQAGTYDKFVVTNTHAKIGVTDPSYGGRDACVFTELHVSDVIRINAAEERSEETKRIIGIGQKVLGPIHASMAVDWDFAQLCRSIVQHRRGLGDTQSDTARFEAIIEGKPIDGATQVAVLAASECLARGIPLDHHTFDGTGYSAAFDAMGTTFGRERIRWHYDGTVRPSFVEGEQFHFWPFERHGEQLIRWSDRVSETSSLVWWFACNLINAGYVLGGDAIEDGLLQLSSRPKDKRVKGKTDVLSKDKLKAAGQISPAHAETFAIGCFFAARHLNLLDLGEMPTMAARQTRHDTARDYWRHRDKAKKRGWRSWPLPRKRA